VLHDSAQPGAAVLHFKNATESWARPRALRSFRAFRSVRDVATANRPLVGLAIRSEFGAAGWYRLHGFCDPYTPLAFRPGREVFPTDRRRRMV